jgi:STE24 endopeptidase
VWSFLVVFSIFLIYISPYAIEPLFFRFEPVAAPGLSERIRILAERAGMRVGRVLKVDASRRSRHSNAYFTGIGRVKRIVLFDTLLESLGPDEIEAVVAHEIGHWKLRHVLRRLVASAAVWLVAMWIASFLLRGPLLPHLVGMESGSFQSRAVILGFLASLLGLPLAPISSGLSRRDERAADRYATRLTGSPGALAGALVRLARENLANLHPHPLYVWFFHSHPPIVERLRALRGAAGGSAT